MALDSQNNETSSLKDDFYLYFKYMFNKILKNTPDKYFIKTFLKVVTPLVLSEMLMIAVGFIDNFMIGNYGADHNQSLASVGIANEILFFGMGCPMFFMTTFSIFLAQYAGKKDDEKMRQTIKFWITTSLSVSIIFAVAVLLAAEPIVKLYNPTDVPVINGAVDYIRYSMPAVIMMVVGFIAMTSAAITGRPKWPLVLGVGSITINIIGDYLLIYVADLGIIGSAIATDISRVFEVTLAGVVFYKYKDINIFINFFHYDWSLFKKEIKKITTAVAQLAFTLSLIGISLVLSRGYGKLAQAALATGYALTGIIWSIFPAVGAGVKIFIGKELGKSNFDEAKANVKKVALSIPFILVPLAVLGIIFAMTLPGPLGAEGKVIIMARNMILTYSCAVFLYAYATLYFNVLSSGGHVRASNIFQNYYQLFVVIPFAVLSIWGLGLSFTSTMIITQALQIVPLIIAFSLEKRYKWLNNLTHEHE